ncbi:hypothetical protein EV652_103387 [Kribbella steppae]|uniref:Uncharacterized protein n=1 Tax=Kribbella steppae TaxID=2512223 RepID=A0A4R2HR48_9ACTN|nr:hypothetical protein [Kribbella steppae]TCO33386.1 hypothetical protein EV652_103387 [Kribbella steppae]
MTLASPLTLLLEEEQHGDRQAEDVLLLSYTIDLGFFEAFGLGAAQACGARVTTVGDARMSQPDPRAARRAGRTYLPGQALCGGAFHPKLVLIAGPSRVTAAIGSGNATLAGWQANAELWSVLYGDATSCPKSLADLASWLRHLPELVRLSHGVPDALTRVAGHLDQLLGQAAEVIDDGVRLVSTSPAPILDHLPVGPVEELAVCAPFHDPGAVALRELVDRLQPQQLRISYQPELTQLDGPAVRALAEQWDAELRQDGESRYRHGKLIEWTVGGARYALTGSPNLSGAALLQPLANGGNCELGLITRVPMSLLPEGGRVAPAAVAGKQFDVRRSARVGALMLGATRTANGLHIMFARALTARGHVELSAAASPPETWERVGEVAAGATEANLTVSADGGSRLRLVTTAEEGALRYSNLVFVVDPVRVVQRPGITAVHTPATRPDDLFADPRLAEKFFGDLVTLKSNLPPAPPQVVAADRSGHDSVSSPLDDDLDGWERYLDECAGRIGHPLLRFALGLPALPGGTGAAFEALLPVSWADEMVSDQQAGLDDDSVEDIAAEQEADTAETPTVIPDLSTAEVGVRRRYRRWAERMTAAAGQVGAPERMLVTRLLLWTAAAGAWDRDDYSWVGLLSQSLQKIGGAEIPVPAEPQIGSLAAVALSVLRSAAPRYVHTQETTAFDNAAGAVAHLLVAADRTYIEEYTQLLGNAFGSSVSIETVEAIAADVVQNDPVADALWALAELDRDAHRHGERMLHVVGRFGNPMLIALEAVGAAQDAEIIGAWASSTSDKWALCIWRRPDLFTIDRGGPRTLWRHYRLTGLLSPRALALQRSLESATAIPHVPHVEPFPEALQALAELGVPSPEPPPD